MFLLWPKNRTRPYTKALGRKLLLLFYIAFLCHRLFPHLWLSAKSSNMYCLLFFFKLLFTSLLIIYCAGFISLIIFFHVPYYCSLDVILTNPKYLQTEHVKKRCIYPHIGCGRNVLEALLLSVK